MGDKTLTTFDVSKICDVYPTTVINWIDDGKLIAYKTPGGHRRVKKSDLLFFLDKYNIPSNINFKKETDYKVLVVEDTDTLFKIINNLDTPINFIIKQANNEFDIGYITAEWKPDLIVLDFKSVYVNCRKLCRRLKSEAALKNISILAVLDTDESIEGQCKQDVDCYVTKPVNIEQFIKKIEFLLA